MKWKRFVYWWRKRRNSKRSEKLFNEIIHWMWKGRRSCRDLGVRKKSHGLKSLELRRDNNVFIAKRKVGLVKFSLSFSAKALSFTSHSQIEFQSSHTQIHKVAKKATCFMQSLQSLLFLSWRPTKKQQKHPVGLSLTLTEQKLDWKLTIEQTTRKEGKKNFNFKWCRL